MSHSKLSVSETSFKIASRAQNNHVRANFRRENVLFSENNIDVERVTFNINPYYEYKTDKNKLLIDFNYVDYKNDNDNKID